MFSPGPYLEWWDIEVVQKRADRVIESPYKARTVEDQLGMPVYTRVLGQKVLKGGKMTKGSEWRLVAQGGRKRAFAGTLLTPFNLGRKRIAVFNVPKD